MASSSGQWPSGPPTWIVRSRNKLVRVDSLVFLRLNYIKINLMILTRIIFKKEIIIRMQNFILKFENYAKNLKNYLSPVILKMTDVSMI